MIKIEHLDHIAIRSADIELSAKWYENILGLERLQPEEWKPWPIFMIANGTGVAIFPLKEEQGEKPFHFAFRVNEESFETAKKHLSANDLPFEFQDHFYFHSLYFNDPDDHTVELTVQVKPLPM